MSAAAADVRIEPASWRRAADRRAVIAIRQTVFVEEQQVPVEIEIDGLDPDCRHLLAFDDTGEPVGTARMTGSGHIGRIAVLAEWRGRGVGARLVDAMIEIARQAGLDTVDLDSQVQAVGFYRKLGFALRGDEFMEAGIPHRNMYRSLAGAHGDPSDR